MIVILKIIFKGKMGGEIKKICIALHLHLYMKRIIYGALFAFFFLFFLFFGVGQTRWMFTLKKPLKIYLYKFCFVLKNINN